MKDGRPNQHGGTCVGCGQWVGPGDGLLQRKQLDDGRWGWVVTHSECPPVADSGDVGEVHHAPMLSPEELALRTEKGRQWLGYWYLRGLRKMPAGMTMDDVATLVGEADVTAMDEAVGFYREVTLAGPSVHDPEWKRAKVMRGDDA